MPFLETGWRHIGNVLEGGEELVVLHPASICVKGLLAGARGLLRNVCGLPPLPKETPE